MELHVPGTEFCTKFKTEANLKIVSARSWLLKGERTHNWKKQILILSWLSAQV